MRKKSIKNLVSILTMAIMLFGTLGMGVFAADQTVEGSDSEGTTVTQDQPTGGDVQKDATEETSEEPTTENEQIDGEDLVAPEDEAVKADELGDVYLDKGVDEIKTVSGHRRILVKWDAITDETITQTPDPEPGATGDEGKDEVQESIPITITKYVILRKQKDLANAVFDEYATVEVNPDGTIANCSGDAFDNNYVYTRDHYLFTKDSKMKYTKWNKSELDINKQMEFENGTYSFQDGDVGDGLADSYSGKTRGGIFYYKIIPYGVVTDELGDKADTPTEYSYDPEKAESKGDACVRTSYVTLKLKASAKLKSHNKGGSWHTFPAGTTIYTSGFGVGQYVFIWKNEVFWLNRIRTKSQKSKYTKNNPYSKEECEYFINHQQGKRGESKGQYLIWVNTYTQRAYIFKGSEGHWTLNNGTNWKVCTGKAKSPTIRHIDPKNDRLDSGRRIGKYADIWKKLSSRHGIKYWNCFSSYNAMHGQKSGWNINGTPKSGGCVRNTNAHAKWIYKNCKAGNDKTRVIIF